MSIYMPETDSEDELPGGWEERATTEGYVYYANHNTKATQWQHPRTGRRKKVSGSMPFGWERVVTEEDKVVYVDHQTKRTTYTDPRLAFAVEIKDDSRGSQQPVSRQGFRQRFDASSNAMQVLHGMDLREKTAIVTGANSGIGFEIARTLAFHGCKVVFTCRKLCEADAAVDRVKKERPHVECVAMHLNLCSLSQVKLFAEEFLKEHSSLDVLVLNAGIFGKGYSLTENELDETFQVNYLSQVYLASLLRDAMSKTLKPRLVVLSAESHRFSNLSAESLCGRSALVRARAAFDSTSAYNDSKLLLLMFCLECNRRWRKSGVRAYATHPGNCVSTNLPRHWWAYRVIFALVRPFAKSPQQAAATPAFASFHPDLEDLSEDHPRYLNNCFPCYPSAVASDQLARDRAWKLTEELLKEKVDGFKEL